MKKIVQIMVIAALGAATLSCEDATYREVEETILEDQIADPHDDYEEYRSKPGSK